MGDEILSECFPCATEDKVFHGTGSSRDLEFIYMYESFLDTLGIRLPFIDFMYSVLN